MKKSLVFLTMLFVVTVAFASGTADEPTSTVAVWEFFKTNWAELLVGLMAFIKVIVRLTPWTKDDEVFGLLDKIISFVVPNFTTKKNAG